MDRPAYAARLRYLDADDVDDAVVDYDGLNVYGPDGDSLGEVDGFIVDADARRVNYIVIDSGGWFTSRRLLLPIGHATLSPDRRALQTDVTREALRRLPEYDEHRFTEFTDDELRAFERNTVAACCPDEPIEDMAVSSWGYDTRRHFRQPEWWSTARYAPERLRPIGSEAPRPIPAGGARQEASIPARDARNRDVVTAREARGDAAGARPPDDMSPHFAGRAQPGDVLGIETGGETTAIGDTAADENDRRREAERTARESAREREQELNGRTRDRGL
jgi:hypothetical protein